MQDSIWFRTLSDADREVFQASDDQPASSDVVIVGAGLIGLSAAYYLTQAGVNNICVVDRKGPLAEASGANAGGLWFGQQSAELGPIAGLARLSQQLYADLENRFSFDYRRSGILDLLHREDDLRGASGRVAATEKAGFGASILSPDDVAKCEPNLRFDGAGAIHFTGEGQIHPAKLAAGLVRHLRLSGVKICREVDVDDVNSLAADQIVIAAGAWTPLVTKALGWTPPIRPIRGTLLALPELPAESIRHTVMAGRYYFWQLAGGAVVCGGSEDDLGFERGVDNETVGAIRSDLNDFFPTLARHETVCAWSGFRPFCEDLRPVIGPVPGNDRIFVAAGHFRKGVMLAPATGKILADLIAGGSTEMDISLLSPARFT